METIQQKYAEVILYPEDEDISLFMNPKITDLMFYAHNHDNSCNYAWICHDEDYFTAEDELKNPEHRAGSSKKKHIHLLLSFSKKVNFNRLADVLGVPVNLVSKVKNYAAAVRYLTHFDTPSKFRYDTQLIYANFDFEPFYSSGAIKTDDEIVNELRDYCRTHRYFSDVIDYALDNGYLSVMRRYNSLLKDYHYWYHAKEFNADYAFSKF